MRSLIEIMARNNPHHFLDPAPVDDQYDYHRDRKVNATDEIIARNNGTNFLTRLNLITVPAGQSGGTAPGAPAVVTDDGERDVLSVEGTSAAGTPESVGRDARPLHGTFSRGPAVSEDKPVPTGLPGPGGGVKARHPQIGPERAPERLDRPTLSAIFETVG